MFEVFAPIAFSKFTMKKELYSLMLFCLVFLIQDPAPAQSTRMFNPLKDDITDVIPSLTVLLDSAYENDPVLKTGAYKVSIEKANLKTSRRLWTQSLGIQGNIGYGTFDYFYNNSGNPEVNQSYISRQNQTQYQVGGWLNLPLSIVTTQRNQVRLAKLKIDQSQSDLAVLRNEVQKQVIKQYYETIGAQRVLKIKSTSLETTRINMQLAEKSFLKGTITVEEYSRVLEIASSTEVDYELARINFLTAYQTLEVMVGMKFNLNTMIQQNNENK
jgi:outer membrane protein TolC